MDIGKYVTTIHQPVLASPGGGSAPTHSSPTRSPVLAPPADPTSRDQPARASGSKSIRRSKWWWIWAAVLVIWIGLKVAAARYN